FATDAKLNLSGENKADALVKNFGYAAFDYAGNSKTDLPVWRVARFGTMVNTSRTFLEQSGASIRISRAFPKTRIVRTYFQSWRVHQWMKNTLLFAPLVLGHRLNDWTLILTGLVAFLAFSLCASGMYIVNDLLDLEADRKHKWKRCRPFASG